MVVIVDRLVGMEGMVNVGGGGGGVRVVIAGIGWAGNTVNVGGGGGPPCRCLIW